MTDDTHKSSSGQASVARTTARDAPFVRSDSEFEPAPRGQRPAQLPRDPTYEQELAQVELAVLRNPERHEDPSTKQARRRGAAPIALEPPDSITPESPGTRLGREGAVVRSPHPPSSKGRAAASGTLLSVGSVDPRGKTERTLETPRMFFSQSEQTEAYFKPGAIPAVTVHQTLETETVKLADSIDPRRAKTIPRLDRAALARLAEMEQLPESDSAVVTPAMAASSLDLPASDASMRWNQREYEAEPGSYSPDDDGQIHASLSPFRGQVESGLDFEGVATRAEPLAGRRAEPPPVSLPHPSAVPTQRDLPAHRIEASRPPPPLAAPASAPRAAAESSLPPSDGPSPTTASIAAGEPERRPTWINYAPFFAVLLVAVIFGLWLMRQSLSPTSVAPSVEVRPTPGAAHTPAAALPVPVREESAPADRPSPPAGTAPGPSATPDEMRTAPSLRGSSPSTKAIAPQAPSAAPRKPSPPPTLPREPIF